MPLIEWELADGGDVYATALHIEQTYAAVYEGFPYTESNDRLLARLPPKAIDLVGGNPSVFVVAPHRRAGDQPVPKGWPFGPAEYLPAYCFIAECYGPDQRWLVVVWFQDEASFRVPDSVRRELERLNWRANAKQWNP